MCREVKLGTRGRIVTFACKCEACDAGVGARLARMVHVKARLMVQLRTRANGSCNSTTPIRLPVAGDLSIDTKLRTDNLSLVLVAPPVESCALFSSVHLGRQSRPLPFSVALDPRRTTCSTQRRAEHAPRLRTMRPLLVLLATSTPSRSILVGLCQTCGH